MKICRFRLKTGQVSWGEMRGERIKPLELVSPDPVIFTSGKGEHELPDCELLLPCDPSQIVGIGDNYRKPGEDLRPTIFLKPRAALVPHRSVVELPENALVWGEPEIGIVLKKSCEMLDDFEPEDFILGFCLINDTTARFGPDDVDTHTPKAKGQPGFCPMGEYISTDFHYESAEISGLHNGVLYRQGAVSGMQWDLKSILREVSRSHRLRPFDVITTGTPPRVNPERKYLQNGDEFVVKVNGLGELLTRYEGRT